MLWKAWKSRLGSVALWDMFIGPARYLDTNSKATEFTLRDIIPVDSHSKVYSAENDSGCDRA